MLSSGNLRREERKEYVLTADVRSEAIARIRFVLLVKIKRNTRQSGLSLLNTVLKIARCRA